jgi:hypothetical protein
MFRYGGPIKEGVMNGIREPKKDGGSMTQRVQPSNDGSRPGYAGPASPFILAGMGIARAAPYVARGARAGLAGLKRIFGPTTTKPAPFSPIRTKITGGYNEYGPANYTRKIIKDTASKSGGVRGAENVGKLGGTEVFTPNILGRDPLIRAGGKIISAVTNPAVTGKLAGAARLVFSPSGAVIGGLYYANGKFFNKNNEEVNPPKGDIKIGGKVGTSGAPGGGDPDMKYNAPPKELTEAEREAATIAARNKQMDMYKEIMDIKGMKKDATYKALIDASQLITSEGDFKGSIKDGSLIAKLIGAADKRFDKVSDTETALRSLVAKGEIENQMNKETKALDKAYKQSALDINKKKLAGATLAEELSAYRTKNDKNASGRKLAGFLMDKNVNVIDIADTVKVDEHIKSGGDAVSFMESIVLKNLEKGTQVTPGIYVVKDAIIQIDENGNVTRARP